MTSEAKRPLLRGIYEDFRGLLRAPRDLWILYGVKLLESVAYFAVIGVLILYLHDDLRFSDQASGAIFGAWGTMVSLMTFVAGVVADAMGQRKALLFGALTLVIGRTLLLGSELPLLALAGLAISVWGVATLKPVMTAAVKRLAPEHLRAFAYTIYYVVMNLGAFAAGHIVSFLRRGLLGRVLRPGELLEGVGPAPEAAREALVAQLLPNFPPPEGAEEAQAGVEALGRVATGGRSFEHWTTEDLGRIAEAARAQLAGQEIPDAPFGLSGYEMIFLVAALLSLLSLLLLRGVRADEAPPAKEEGQGERPASVGGGSGAVFGRALRIGAELLKERTFWAFLLFISLLVLVRAIFVHAHSTWPTYMVRELGEAVPQAAVWSLNPLLIIVLTPILGSLTSKRSSWSVIQWGSFITAFSVLFMVVPRPFEAAARAALEPVLGSSLDYRLAGPILFVAVLSVGEALWSPRLYEYVALMAPKKRESSYMGLAELPLFAAKPVVGLMSGTLLSHFCPEHGPRQSELMWLIIFLTTLAGPILALFFSGFIRAAEKAKVAEAKEELAEESSEPTKF